MLRLVIQESSPTARIPIATPIHCHHLSFSLNATAENTLVIISAATDLVGYKKLVGKRGSAVTSSILKKFEDTLQAPDRIGNGSAVLSMALLSRLSLAR